MGTILTTTGRLRTAAGFTLIELMLVVAMISILAAIAIPRFADMVGHSEEGATKANLGVLRTAISIYYSDTEGIYPADLDTLTIGDRYLNTIPTAVLPSHT